MEVQPREVKRYFTANGKFPFDEWLNSLRDRQAAAKIKARLRRIELGNLGDWKPLKESKVCELRFIGPSGYRVYFGKDQEVIWILLGGNKDSQDQDIPKAEEYWADYEQRKGISK